MRRARVAGLAQVLVALSAASCGGRIALYQNVPDGGAGVGGSTSTAGATGAQGGAGGSFSPPPDLNLVWLGAGCGRPLPPNQQATVPGSPTGYTQFTVVGTGANLTATRHPEKAGPRTFWVRVPADYDPNHAYRVVFVGQHCGGAGSANVLAIPFFKRSAGGNEQAIYVALDIPADMANPDCYDNRSGAESREWEAFQLFMDFVDAKYCVDRNRIYVAGGYDTGAALANQWGCYFAGTPTPPRKFAPTFHIRAQAANRGTEPPALPTCGGPVAAIFLHDTLSNTAPFADALKSLARVGAANGCDTNWSDPSLQEEWHPEIAARGVGICKRFFKCPQTHPVVFCATTGVNMTNDEFHAIPAFTAFFDELAAQTGGTVPIP